MIFSAAADPAGSETATSNDASASADALPILVCLHFLGGSARSWERVAQCLDGVVRCVLLDLPGFGDAAGVAGYSVTEMADAVVARVAEAAPSAWMLAGHSMGAKVAAVVARRAEDGDIALSGLAGLVLVAGSPPAPEPMGDERRQAMRRWFHGEPDESGREADGFVRGAVDRALDPALHDRTVNDVLRMNRAAWLAWLDSGSLEDWSDRIGVLAVPTLILAGEGDADLGPSAQRRLMARHFAHARLVALPKAGHLLPMEWPDEVAALIVAHLHATGAGSQLDMAYRRLIDSDRVSSRTRALLLARAAPDDPAYEPAAISRDMFPVLRAMLDRVLPQEGHGMDLAARIDAQLASASGDGWRFAALPIDPAAYEAGLRTLDAVSGHAFCSLDPEQQDALLRSVAAGDVGDPSPGRLDAGQMVLWFEDVRSDAVRIYVAHPGTLARIGYSGIGYGGDGEPKPGFHAVGPGEREAWEPEAASHGP